MKTYRNFIIISLIGMLAFAGCENDPAENILEKDNITGYVQKGPFINGTTITIAELNSKMSPTGRTFSTEILDNAGTFNLSEVKLASQYVEVKADGYYFNEVLGDISASTLKLSALADLSSQDKVNVNVISHLEKSRVDYLVANKGYSFAKAKEQAIKEILAVFSIEKTDIAASEHLNIVQAGDDNAILLAVSIILQGERPTSELSELLANINTDLREDGVLNDENLQQALIGRLQYMSLSNIRQNLATRYQSLGIQADIPNFEKYVTMFLENTTFVNPGATLYPVNGEYGVNILYPGVTEIDSHSGTGTYYSFAADIPAGTSLKVKITVLEKSDQIYDITVFGGGASVTNWKVSNFNLDNYTQFFEVIESGKKSDLQIRFYKGDHRIDYYENGAAEPTFSKILTVGYSSDIFPSAGTYGKNILHPGVDTIAVNTDYSLRSLIAAGDVLTVELTNPNSATATWTVADIDNWNVTETTHFLNFSVIEGGRASDLRIRFQAGEYGVLVRYNNNLIQSKNLYAK